MKKSELINTLQSQIKALLSGQSQATKMQGEQLEKNLTQAIDTYVKESDQEKNNLKNNVRSLESQSRVKNFKKPGEPFKLTGEGLIRLSTQQPASCKYQDKICNQDCVAFQRLGNGNIMICDKTEIKIVEE